MLSVQGRLTGCPFSYLNSRYSASTQEDVPSAAAPMLGMGRSIPADQGTRFRKLQPLQKTLPKNTFTALSLAGNHNHALRTLGLFQSQKSRQDLKRAFACMPMQIECCRNRLLPAANGPLVLSVLRGWQRPIAQLRRCERARFVPHPRRSGGRGAATGQGLDRAARRRPGAFVFFGKVSPAHARRSRALAQQVQTPMLVPRRSCGCVQLPHAATRPRAAPAH